MEGAGAGLLAPWFLPLMVKSVKNLIKLSNKALQIIYLWLSGLELFRSWLAGWVCYHLHSSLYEAPFTGRGQVLTPRGWMQQALRDPLSVGHLTPRCHSDIPAALSALQRLGATSRARVSQAPGRPRVGRGRGTWLGSRGVRGGVWRAQEEEPRRPWGSVALVLNGGGQRWRGFFRKAGLVPESLQLPALPGVPRTTPWPDSISRLGNGRQVQNQLTATAPRGPTGRLREGGSQPCAWAAGQLRTGARLHLQAWGSRCAGISPPALPAGLPAQGPRRGLPQAHRTGLFLQRRSLPLFLFSL